MINQQNDSKIIDYAMEIKLIQQFDLFPMNIYRQEIDVRILKKDSQKLKNQLEKFIKYLEKIPENTEF